MIQCRVHVGAELGVDEVLAAKVIGCQVDRNLVQDLHQNQHRRVGRTCLKQEEERNVGLFSRGIQVVARQCQTMHTSPIHKAWASEGSLIKSSFGKSP